MREKSMELHRKRFRFIIDLIDQATISNDKVAINPMIYVNQMNRPLNPWLVQVRKSSGSLEPVANNGLLDSNIRKTDIPSLANAYQKRITTPEYAKMKVC